MPVYNEQDCIKKVLIDWMTALSPLNIKISFIIINDGSTDQTSQILKNLEEEQKNSSIKLIILNVKNGGHGAAIMTGIQKAILLNDEKQRSFIFQIDSDDQFISQDFFKLWPFCNDYHFIFGHRQVRHDAPNRLIISSIMRILIKIFFNLNTFDPNIPFRLMEINALKKILKHLPSTLFAPNIFITILALSKFPEKCKQGIVVTHKRRATGKVSIMNFKLLKVCFKSLKQLIHFKFISSE